MALDHITRPSLLLRVRDREDQESWVEFVEIYGPLIHRFALSRGVLRDHAPDITQDVLRNVSRAMHAFEYDRSKGTFRSWLFTIIRREITRTAEKAHRQPGNASDDDPSVMLEQLTDPEESHHWETDYQTRLIHWAMDKIRSEFSEKSWLAFLAIALDGKSPKAVATSLEMSVGSIYVAKSRVLKRLTEKIHSVDEDEWELDLIAQKS